MKVEYVAENKLLVCFICLLISYLTEAFQVSSSLSVLGRDKRHILQNEFEGKRCISYSAARVMARMRKLDDDDDDDEDDDDYIDDNALGDWRTFRSTLVGSGLSSSDFDNSSIEDLEEEGGNVSKPLTKEDGNQGKGSVSANVEMLFSQSDKLGEEYLSGAWVHEAPDVEIGGLVVRLPLEAEIYRNKEKNVIGKELTKRLDTEDEGSSGSSFLSLGAEDQPNTKNPNLSFSLVAAQTLLWYKKAQKLIDEEMSNIAGLANASGQIDPRELDSKGESLLNLYLDYQTTWQEVCLIADRNSKEGTATTFVLNRPMSFRLNKSLARLVLFGAYGAMTDRIPVSQTQQLVKFLTAFENNCAIYGGGPDNVDEPAVIMHGFVELEGAEEIAPGTKIYRGGIDAAIDGVIKGKYDPLDFRFFVGCHDYKDGALDLSVHTNKFQPLACARPIVLKQCISLPKPLWHEVLELCGGELREISKLELMRRDDIQVD
mmetsp:Transcript_1698/g.2238  ORF Transcript_1698/g.2238 Transcript_1698/m.2238 type:complete len:487 (-) Transcript_1698:689-2149(-)